MNQFVREDSGKKVNTCLYFYVFLDQIDRLDVGSQEWPHDLWPKMTYGTKLLFM